MGFFAYVQLTPWLSLALMIVFIAACSLSGAVNPDVWWVHRRSTTDSRNRKC